MEYIVAVLVIAALVLVVWKKRDVIKAKVGGVAGKVSGTNAQK